MTKIHDISQTIRAGIPVWPGDTDFAHDLTWGIDADCPVNVSKLTMSTHTGTHADAPLHYGADGADSADSNLIPYIGEALVLDISGLIGDSAQKNHLEGKIPVGTSRVILKLMPTFPHDSWPTGFPVIAAEAIEYLAEAGVILIGTDSPSLDPETSKTMDAHKAVERAGMAILEGLVLDDIREGTYELIALPLKIMGADASPVRAILREL